MYIKYQIGFEQFGQDTETYNFNTGCCETTDVTDVKLWVKSNEKDNFNPYTYQDQITDYLNKQYPDYCTGATYISILTKQEHAPDAFVLNVE